MARAEAALRESRTARGVIARWPQASSRSYQLLPPMCRSVVRDRRRSGRQCPRRSEFACVREGTREMVNCEVDEELSRVCSSGDKPLWTTLRPPFADVGSGRDSTHDRSRPPQSAGLAKLTVAADLLPALGVGEFEGDFRAMGLHRVAALMAGGSSASWRASHHRIRRNVGPRSGVLIKRLRRCSTAPTGTSPVAWGGGGAQAELLP